MTSKLLIYYCSIASLLLQAAPLSAQEMSRSVVGNAGDYFEHPLVGNIHFTVGEVAVAHYQNGLELGEGFHHLYYDLVVDTREPMPVDWQVNIFPNPATDELRIDWDGEGELHAQLYNGTGQLLQSHNDLNVRHQLDVSQLPAGVYWLRLSDEQGHQRSYQVQKILR